MARRGEEIVDPTGTRQDRRRATTLRIVLPFALVGTVIAAIGLIAFHSYVANRHGALRLTRDLLRATGAEVSGQVSAYLTPALQTMRVANDLLAHTNAADRPVAFRAYAASTLRQVGSIEAFSLANSRGDFAVIRRAADGGTRARLLRVGANGQRMVVTELRDDAGTLLSTVPDGGDTFKPKAQPWFAGAVAHPGAPFWSAPYVFRATGRPVITVSLGRVDADGEAHVAAIDIALDALSRFVAGLQLGAGGQAAVADAAGHLVASSDLLARGAALAAVGTLDPRRDPVLAGAWDRYRALGPGAREIRSGQRAFVAIAAPLGDAAPGWVLLLAVPERDFASFAAVDGRRNLLFSLVIVALALLLAANAVRSGIRADRVARRLAAARAEAADDGRLLGSVAAAHGVFDPRHEAPLLTETLAELAGARRAALWGIAADGMSLTCEDQYDRAGNDHVGGFALARDELPRLFALIQAAEAVEVADAARDGRTAEFHRLAMRDAATRSLALHPVAGPDGPIGALVIEDAERLGRARNLIRSVGAIAALRLAAGRGAEAAAAASADAPASAPAPAVDQPRSRVAGLLASDPDLLAALDGSGAAVYPAASVLVLSFLDAGTGGARRDAAAVVEAAGEMARAVQEVGRRFALPYLKIVGHGLVAATGLSAVADPAEAVRLAEAALAIRHVCLDATERADLDAAFAIGLDVGRLVGQDFGDEPAVFNVWGEALRAAELMARTAAEPGTIQVTEAASLLLRSRFLLRSRGRFFMPRTGVSRCFVLAGPR